MAGWNPLDRGAVMLIAAIIVILIVSAVALNYYNQYGASHSSGVPQYGKIAAKGAILGVDGVPMNLSMMGKARAYGIKWMRNDISFTPLFQAYMQNLSRSGFSMVGILDYDTVGAQISGNGCIANCNWTLAQWNASVSNAISQYPWVHVWEIWNEPQITRYQSGFYNGSPKNYFLMLKSAYDIIKAHNSSATVLCLGGANLYYGGLEPAISDFQWTQQLWGYGAGQYCDAISIHIYSAFTYLLNQTPMLGAVAGNQTIGQMFNASLAQYENLTGKPLWVTETGIPSGVNQSYQDPYSATPQKQATYLNQTFSLLLSKPYTKAIFWYHLYGLNSPPYNIDFGLFSPGMSPKPSWYAFNGFVSRLNSAA